MSSTESLTLDFINTGTITVANYVSTSESSRMDAQGKRLRLGSGTCLWSTHFKVNLVIVLTQQLNWRTRCSVRSGRNARSGRCHLEFVGKEEERVS